MHDLDALRGEFQAELAAAATVADLDLLDRRWVKARKGELFGGVKTLPVEERKAYGQRLNELFNAITADLAGRRTALAEQALARDLHDPRFDATLPGVRRERGSFHPIDLVQHHLERVFQGMGFHVLDYPELELEAYNFEGLNIPKDHPARDMQDTFWVDPAHGKGLLLRTHTSAGQVRAMHELTPPFRAVFPGRVYRMEAVDASHEHTFHQLEGLMIDKDVSVANLISSMKTLLSTIFEREVTIRLRPGYFPFVEPGFELDLKCMVCGGSGCSVCKQSGWVELLPCGLVHPNVLKAGGLDPDQWSGWAFGLGLSRLVMMKYQLDDIRLLLGSDLRFLSQFSDVL